MERKRELLRGERWNRPLGVYRASATVPCAPERTTWKTSADKLGVTVCREETRRSGKLEVVDREVLATECDGVRCTSPRVAAQAAGALGDFAESGWRWQAIFAT